MTIFLKNFFFFTWLNIKKQLKIFLFCENRTSIKKKFLIKHTKWISFLFYITFFGTGAAVFQFRTMKNWIFSSIYLCFSSIVYFSNAKIYVFLKKNRICVLFGGNNTEKKQNSWMKGGSWVEPAVSFLSLSNLSLCFVLFSLNFFFSFLRNFSSSFFFVQHLDMNTGNEKLHQVLMGRKREQGGILKNEILSLIRWCRSIQGHWN